MNLTMVILRVIHIGSGVVWAGGGIFMARIIGPTAEAVGQDAQKFMQELILRSRFTAMMTATAILTVLSGLTMYWLTYKGIAPLNTGSGLALTFGGLFGLAAFYVGIFHQGRPAQRLKAIAGEVAAAGGPPTPEQMAEMGALQGSIAKFGEINATLFALAILGMSLSEYFAF